MPSITYVNTILRCFTAMEIDELRFFLKEEYIYENTTKEIFLNEIERIFLAHKNSGDTELLLYPGTCVGKICPNCRNRGYRFVGNYSHNYFDLLFELRGDDITGIYNCPEFKTDTEIPNLGTQADIYIHIDDQVDFAKTPEYWAKVYAAKAACNELGTTNLYDSDIGALKYWAKKHEHLYNELGGFDPFEPPMKWSLFLMQYSNVKNRIDEMDNES